MSNWIRNLESVHAVAVVATNFQSFRLHEFQHLGEPSWLRDYVRTCREGFYFFVSIFYVYIIIAILPQNRLVQQTELSVACTA